MVAAPESSFAIEDKLRVCARTRTALALWIMWDKFEKQEAIIAWWLVSEMLEHYFL